jgi:hypothetical protein
MSSSSPDFEEISPRYRVLRVRAVLVAVGLLLAGILLFSLRFDFESTWHCSAAQPRPKGVTAWKKTTTPAEPLEKLSEAFFADFTVTSGRDNFIVEHHIGHRPDNPFAYEVQRITPGETLNIGGGTLAFCGMGTAYLGATQTMEDDTTYRFYDAELRSMGEEQAKVLKTHRFIEKGASFRYAPFPGVQFGFKYEGIEDLMLQGIRFFDASTKKEISGGSSSSSGDQVHYWFSTHIPLWHRTPVDVVLEVSYGPSKTFEFAPQVGEGFSEENYECRLICVLEGVDTRSRSSSSRDNTVIYEFPKAQPDKAGLRFVFACQPAAIKMPVTFEFLDADGNVLPGSGSSTSGYTHTPSLEHPLEKVALIRARYRTQRRRLLIHLPYIPGLPDQNKEIDDLFDVHVPYVRLHDPGQVGGFLRQVLQLETGRRTGPPPPNSINNSANSGSLFPMEFRDATIREIAQIYAEGGALRIDVESEQLSVEYPVPLSTRLRQFLQTVLRRN